MLKKILMSVVMLTSFVLIGCNLSTDTTNQTTILTTTITSTTSDQTTETDTTTTNNTTGETTIIYVVSFDSKGGSAVNPNYVLSGSTTTLPISEQEGYTFLGWTLNDNPDDEIILEPFQPTSDMTLYAKWIINQYTIVFDTDGGSEVAPITQDYDTLVLQPEDPIKEGFIFIGWFTDSELSSLYDFSTMPSENITVYAGWEAEDWSDVETYLAIEIP